MVFGMGDRRGGHWVLLGRPEGKSPFERTISKHKGKSVPLQAWSGPEGSRKLRFLDFHDNGPAWW